MTILSSPIHFVVMMTIYGMMITSSTDAFSSLSSSLTVHQQRQLPPTSSITKSMALHMSGSDENAVEDKAAPMVTGEELEMMLTEWDKPLVVDAYATWCGPCLLMSPEYESAAQELKDKVRFVKLDTDKEEEMATRLNIMGLPTLLFLDKYVPKDDDEGNAEEAKAVLKGRIEGALRKQNIIDLCNFYFFDGPEPKI